MNNVSLTFQRVLQFPLRRTLEYQKLLATVADLYPAVSFEQKFQVVSFAFDFSIIICVLYALSALALLVR